MWRYLRILFFIFKIATAGAMAYPCSGQPGPQNGVWSFNIQRTTPAQVVELYRLILGREPEPAGLKNWSTVKFSCDESAYHISRSDEARKKVGDIFLKYLGRNATPEELSKWLAALQTDGLDKVRAKVMALPEANQRPVSGWQFAGGLNECRYLLNACDYNCQGNLLCFHLCAKELNERLGCANPIQNIFE